MQGTKALFAAVGIVVGLRLAVWLFHVMWFFAILLLPMVVAAAVLYAIGYAAPADWRKAVEKQIRAGLDWLDFHAPSWSWPIISLARASMDWLGIHVPRVS